MGKILVCTVCKTPKNLSEFHKNKTSAHGRRGDCKACRGFNQYQTRLYKQLTQGVKNIINCEKCDGLIKKPSDNRLCKRCRNNEKPLYELFSYSLE
jgi:RecJ-like exonuclease